MKEFALIRYKKRKGETKAARPLLVEFKPGSNKTKARPFNKNRKLIKNQKREEETSWLRRWFNNKY